MTTALIAATGYLVASFILSAVIVRLAPRAHSARQIRKNLTLFTVLPLLLVVDVLASIDALRRMGAKLLRSAFEAISGRRLQSGDSYGYGYFGYRRRRQNRRMSDRRTRNIGVTAKGISQSV